MDSKELLQFCLEKGILLDGEVLNLLSDATDSKTAKLIIEKIKESTHERFITKSIFERNKEKVSEFFLELPTESQKRLEKLKIKLGLSIEISQEVQKETINEVILKKEEETNPVKIFSTASFSTKKLEVGDFVTYFRNRFSEMRDILQNRSQLDNLVSINKISGNNQKISLIGLVSDKKFTKNRNILLEVEDLTGKIRLLVGANKKDVYEKAEEITLDSVIGFKCSGNREILFVNDIFSPESNIFERKKSPVEEYALFIGDLHVGSKLFLEKSFLKFIDYLNGKLPNTPEAGKIKYLFIVGDVVSGVGAYPNQERDLQISDLEGQFLKFAEFLGKIRKDIQIIISPGNHDGVRLMEPQPIFGEKYAWPLYNLKNVILTTNPCNVTIGEKKNFPGFNVLTYHGFSYPYYVNNIPSLISAKAIHSPNLIMKYLLMNRHLAPTHSSNQYYPSPKDPLLIREIPDIMVSGHLHKSHISYYNNILMIAISSWEGITANEEKMGLEPDFCKVPMFNLKTRAIKILDFEEKEDGD
ncbi:MAG: metallophosphoesterase [Nanoarchaeota archaeon]|nr:metallophosphoesterase [Nanoarchaeota archaeon]